MGLAVAPAKPCGHAAQHAGFGRADAQRAGFPLGFLGRVPQVGHDVDAAAAHHGDARVFRFVDVVDVDGFVHQARGIVVHVGRYERGEIQPRLGLGIGFVLDQLVGDLGCGLVFRDELRRCGGEHLFRAEDSGRNVLSGVVFLIHNEKIIKVYIPCRIHKLCQRTACGGEPGPWKNRNGAWESPRNFSIFVISL